MTTQTYSTRSNAQRAAEKALGSGNYTLRQIGSVWIFGPSAEAGPTQQAATEANGARTDEPKPTAHADKPALTGTGEHADAAQLDALVDEHDPDWMTTESENAGEPNSLSGDGGPVQRRHRPGTKQALLIEMLSRSEGATIAEIMGATGWLSHTVRGAMAGALKKRLGLTITSAAEDRRGRVYRIAG